MQTTNIVHTVHYRKTSYNNFCQRFVSKSCIHF